MKSASFFLGTAGAGGLTFWLPSIALWAIRAESFSGIDALALTGLLPLMAIAATFIADRITCGSKTVAATPLAVCVGLWAFGPLAMAISATSAGGGFAIVDSGLKVLALTAMFPLTTFMMATYEGSLGGLLLGSVVLLTMFRRRRKADANARDLGSLDLT